MVSETKTVKRDETGELIFYQLTAPHGSE